MKLIKFSIIALVLTISAQFANAQVRVGVGVHIGNPRPYRQVVYRPHPVYYPRPAYYPRTVVYRGGYRRAFYGRPGYRRASYGPAYRGRGYYRGHGFGRSQGFGRGHGRHR